MPFNDPSFGYCGKEYSICHPGDRFYEKFRRTLYTASSGLQVVYNAYLPGKAVLGTDGEGWKNSGAKKYHVVLTMDEKTVKAVNAILKRGNDVGIRWKGGGYIVLEVKRSIKYSA